MNRRSFIFNTLFISTLYSQCKQKLIEYTFRIIGKNHILGHKLYANQFPKPTETIHKDVVIIGGGISGLSAARALEKRHFTDYLILEMEHKIGGNATSSENQYSKYPLGAHYIPLPNIEHKELIELLTEAHIITGFDQENFPIYDELSLAFDPMERIYYKNRWHEGLLVKSNEQHTQRLSNFFSKIEFFRKERGFDHKYIFNIPIDEGSIDTQYDYLDQISMKEWLMDEKLACEELDEYVNYCCRDDYGLGYEFISAWAGIHYFASRKFNSTPKPTDSVLTWAEGNGKLASYLHTFSKEKTIHNALAYQIKVEQNSVSILYWDDKNKKSVEIISKQVIMATPQFINKYLIKNRNSEAFTYAPWFVATIILKPFSMDDNTPLSWENIIYKGQGLGFVNDMHQSLSQEKTPMVWTYYYSYNSSDTTEDRKKLYKSSESELKSIIIQDLKIAYPLIEEYIISIELYKIGHGMIAPTLGFIKGNERKNAAQSIDNKIHFCHSDISGISIFEEAFYRGNMVGSTINL